MTYPAYYTNAIIDGPGTGKTRKLLEEANKVNGLVVCSNPDSMFQKARAYGFTNLLFVSYDDFYTNPTYYSHRDVYVDEIEIFLRAMCHYGMNHFAGYTLSNQ